MVFWINTFFIFVQAKPTKKIKTLQTWAFGLTSAYLIPSLKNLSLLENQEWWWVVTQGEADIVGEVVGDRWGNECLSVRPYCHSYIE